MGQPEDKRILKLANYPEETAPTGLIHTGLQGLNKALGKRMGIGLGESIVVTAVSTTEIVRGSSVKK